MAWCLPNPPGDCGSRYDPNQGLFDPQPCEIFTTEEDCITYSSAYSDYGCDGCSWTTIQEPFVQDCFDSYDGGHGTLGDKNGTGPTNDLSPNWFKCVFMAENTDGDCSIIPEDNQNGPSGTDTVFFNTGDEACASIEEQCLRVQVYHTCPTSSDPEEAWGFLNIPCNQLLNVDASTNNDQFGAVRAVCSTTQALDEEWVIFAEDQNGDDSVYPWFTEQTTAQIQFGVGQETMNQGLTCCAPVGEVPGGEYCGTPITTIDEDSGEEITGIIETADQCCQSLGFGDYAYLVTETNTFQMGEYYCGEQNEFYFNSMTEACQSVGKECIQEDSYVQFKSVYDDDWENEYSWHYFGIVQDLGCAWPSNWQHEGGLGYNKMRVRCIGGVETSSCTDPSACNYNPNATVDNGSCEYDSCRGCIDYEACNYGGDDILWDDGSCEYDSCGGCMDPAAQNFDPDAQFNDDSCIPNLIIFEFEQSPYYDEPLVLNQGEEGDITLMLPYAWPVYPDINDLPGTIEAVYDSNFIDDVSWFSIPDFNIGSKLVVTAKARNNLQDETTPVSLILGDYELVNFNVQINWVDCYGIAHGDARVDENGVCSGGQTGLVPNSHIGCTDPNAKNYNPSAEEDDGSCIYPPNYGLPGQAFIEGVGEVTPGDLVTLDASSTHDPEGMIASYLWEQIEGTPITPNNNWDSPTLVFNAPDTGIQEDTLRFRISTLTTEGTTSDYSYWNVLVVPNVGCTNPEACNYSPSATGDDGSCVMPSECGCDGPVPAQEFVDDMNTICCSSPTQCCEDTQGNQGYCDSEDISQWKYYCGGCPSGWIEPEDSIGFDIQGCTDQTACNWSQAASVDNGSCWYPIDGCTCDDGINAFLDQCEVCNGDGTSCLGCTDSESVNYDSNATVDNGNCYPSPSPSPLFGSGTMWGSHWLNFSWDYNAPYSDDTTNPSPTYYMDTPVEDEYVLLTKITTTNPQKLESFAFFQIGTGGYVKFQIWSDRGIGSDGSVDLAYLNSQPDAILYETMLQHTDNGWQTFNILDAPVVTGDFWIGIRTQSSTQKIPGYLWPEPYGANVNQVARSVIAPATEPLTGWTKIQNYMISNPEWFVNVIGEWGGNWEVQNNTQINWHLFDYYSEWPHPDYHNSWMFEWGLREGGCVDTGAINCSSYCLQCGEGGTENCIDDGSCEYDTTSPTWLADPTEMLQELPIGSKNLRDGDECAQHTDCDYHHYCHSGWNGTYYGPRYCVSGIDADPQSDVGLWCNENPCGPGDGDCDNDAQCGDGSYCGTNNCTFNGTNGFGWTSDCCTSFPVHERLYPVIQTYHSGERDYRYELCDTYDANYCFPTSPPNPAGGYGLEGAKFYAWKYHTDETPGAGVGCPIGTVPIYRNYYPSGYADSWLRTDVAAGYHNHGIAFCALSPDTDPAILQSMGAVAVQSFYLAHRNNHLHTIVPDQYQPSGYYFTGPADTFYAFRTPNTLPGDTLGLGSTDSITGYADFTQWWGNGTVTQPVSGEYQIEFIPGETSLIRYGSWQLYPTDGYTGQYGGSYNTQDIARGLVEGIQEDGQTFLVEGEYRLEDIGYHGDECRGLRIDYGDGSSYRWQPDDGVDLTTWTSFSFLNEDVNVDSSCPSEGGGDCTSPPKSFWPTQWHACPECSDVSDHGKKLWVDVTPGAGTCGGVVIHLRNFRITRVETKQTNVPPVDIEWDSGLGYYQEIYDVESDTDIELKWYAIDDFDLWYGFNITKNNQSSGFVEDGGNVRLINPSYDELQKNVVINGTEMQYVLPSGVNSVEVQMPSNYNTIGDSTKFISYAYDEYNNISIPNHVHINWVLLGCTNPNSSNYNPEATVDDGTCNIEVLESSFTIPLVEDTAGNPMPEMSQYIKTTPYNDIPLEEAQGGDLFVLPNQGDSNGTLYGIETECEDQADNLICKCPTPNGHETIITNIDCNWAQDQTIVLYQFDGDPEHNQWEYDQCLNTCIAQTTDYGNCTDKYAANGPEEWGGNGEGGVCYGDGKWNKIWRYNSWQGFSSMHSPSYLTGNMHGQRTNELEYDYDGGYLPGTNWANELQMWAFTYFIPDETGTYTFYVRWDDHLYVSFDGGATAAFQQNYSSHNIYTFTYNFIAGEMYQAVVGTWEGPGNMDLHIRYTKPSEPVVEPASGLELGHHIDGGEWGDETLFDEGFEQGYSKLYFIPNENFYGYSNPFDLAFKNPTGVGGQEFTKVTVDFYVEPVNDPPSINGSPPAYEEQQVVCKMSNYNDYSATTLSCPEGMIIHSVDFDSFGLPAVEGEVWGWHWDCHRDHPFDKDCHCWCSDGSSYQGDGNTVADCGSDLGCQTPCETYCNNKGLGFYTDPLWGVTGCGFVKTDANNCPGTYGSHRGCGHCEPPPITLGQNQVEWIPKCADNSDPRPGSFKRRFTQVTCVNPNSAGVYTIQEDTEAIIPITIDDIDTSTIDLTLTGTSSDQTKVRDEDITILNYGGTERALQIQPVENAVGSVTIHAIVSDGELTSAVSFFLQITPLPDAPIGVNDTFEVLEDMTSEITLNAYDVDLLSYPNTYPGEDITELELLEFEILSQPANGNVEQLSNVTCTGDHCTQTFNYTPNENYFGEDSFTYRVFDGTYYSDQYTITLNVGGAPDAPVIFIHDSQNIYGPDMFGNLRYELDEGGETFIDVWVFDVDTDRDLDLDYQITDSMDIIDDETISIELVGEEEYYEADGMNVLTIDYLENVGYSFVSTVVGWPVKVKKATFKLSSLQRFFGWSYITFTITDGDGEIDTTNITLKVNPTGYPPEVNWIQTQNNTYPLQAYGSSLVSVSEDVETTFQVSVSYFNMSHFGFARENYNVLVTDKNVVEDVDIKISETCGENNDQRCLIDVPNPEFEQTDVIFDVKFKPVKDKYGMFNNVFDLSFVDNSDLSYIITVFIDVNITPDPDIPEFIYKPNNLLFGSNLDEFTTPNNVSNDIVLSDSGLWNMRIDTENDRVLSYPDIFTNYVFGPTRFDAYPTETFIELNGGTERTFKQVYGKSATKVEFKEAYGGNVDNNEIWQELYLEPGTYTLSSWIKHLGGNLFSENWNYDLSLRVNGFPWTKILQIPLGAVLRNSSIDITSGTQNVYLEDYNITEDGVLGEDDYTIWSNFGYTSTAEFINNVINENTNPPMSIFEEDNGELLYRQDFDRYTSDGILNEFDAQMFKLKGYNNIHQYLLGRIGETDLNNIPLRPRLRWEFVQDTAQWDNDYYEHITNISNYDDIGGTDYDDYDRYCYTEMGCTGNDLSPIDESLLGKLPHCAIWDGNYWIIIGNKKSKVRVSLSARGGDDSELHIGVFGLQLKEGSSPLPLVQTNGGGIILPKYTSPSANGQIKLAKRFEDEDQNFGYEEINLLSGNSNWEAEFDGDETITINTKKQWPE